MTKFYPEMVVFLFIQQCFNYIYIIIWCPTCSSKFAILLAKTWSGLRQKLYPWQLFSHSCFGTVRWTWHTLFFMLGLHERQCVCTECIGLIMHSVCVCLCVCFVGLGGCGVIGSCIIALLCYQRYFGGCVSPASHLLITQGLSVPFSVHTHGMN